MIQDYLQMDFLHPVHIDIGLFQSLKPGSNLSILQDFQFSTVYQVLIHIAALIKVGVPE